MTCITCSDKLVTFLHGRLLAPLPKWRTWLRRAYILTWPASMVVKWVLLIGLMFTIWGAMIAEMWANCWRGQE
jgi:hypothetical protein